jgi:hypothetical protein
MSNVEFIAVQIFKVSRRSTDAMQWSITVEDAAGRVLDTFTAPTMKEAESDFEQAGYKNAICFSGAFIFLIRGGGLA